MNPAAFLPPLLATLAVGGAPAALAAASTPPPSPGEIVAAAPAGDWRDIAADDLLVMTLAPDARGKARRVVIQLAPPLFSRGWVSNIRLLARARWFDGIAVVRVQDNYVVQWGDPDGEEAGKAKPLPPGLQTMTESDYTTSAEGLADFGAELKARQGEANRIGEIAMAGSRTGGAPNGWHERDAFAPWVEIVRGWPVASDGSRFWPIHCYGHVGVGRGMSPDTGTGAELYTVIGHAPRHLDRNIAVVGRIVEGIEHLSSLPRGTGPLGFYEQPEERTPIVSIRLAGDLPAAERPRFQWLDTGSESFARYADARANRRDPFFIVPAGGADVCSISVPVRRAP